MVHCIDSAMALQLYNNHFTYKETIMILTRIIRGFFEPLLEVLLWVTLIVALVAGANFDSIMGVFYAFLIWLVIAILFLGAVLIIADIRKIVKNIEQRQAEK